MHIHLENTQNVKEVWKMNKIRVLIVKPNQEPKQMKIEHTLDKLQNIVGGLIEYVDLDYQTDLICNEEGKLLGMEWNRRLGDDIIAGTFLVVGQHNGDTISLSRKQIKKYKKVFSLENNQVEENLILKIIKSNCLK